MEKLISELIRLYLLPGSPAAQALAQRGEGRACAPVDLAADGVTRAIVLPFRRAAGEDAHHWDRLCTVANALQADFALPAPAVSVASAGGYVLWLSLAVPVPLADARRFVDGLARLWPDTLPAAGDVVGAPVELPPCLDAATGRWAAFIHPGMGASFADESGLEMAPPAPGQVAFLDGLESISADRFQAALARLAPGPASVQPLIVAAPRDGGTPAGLLLKDATLDDIVRHLHARNIEPTFRFLVDQAQR
ncbi:hypothetical protein HAV22_27045 [Massilia sp. TW-1]|uniref:SseB protein N-terminal domain-containing protein n=1 Tax=Telluria antibiotica TaxID=2717319 RepID=A0ABX0PJQ7_9BURK|nr:hypothetical protein [Telluria antibiotica]NIA57285.1 hypothetical protein [Telluria antibiotica]